MYHIFVPRCNYRQIVACVCRADVCRFVHLRPRVPRERKTVFEIQKKTCLCFIRAISTTFMTARKMFP